MVLRRVLLGAHDSASSGEWSHDGHVVGKTSFSWPVPALASRCKQLGDKDELTWRAYNFVAAQKLVCVESNLAVERAIEALGKASHGQRAVYVST